MKDNRIFFNGLNTIIVEGLKNKKCLKKFEKNVDKKK